MNIDDMLESIRPEVDPPARLRTKTFRRLRGGGFIGRAPDGPPSASRRSGSTVHRLAMAAGLVLAFVGGRVTAPSVDWSDALAGTFAILLYNPANFNPTNVGQDVLVRAYGDWIRSEREEGRLLVAERLGVESRWIGPPMPGASDRADAPSGMFIVRAPDIDAARAIAEASPHRRFGGSSLIRPIASN